MENKSVRSSSLRLSTVATTTRQTPKTDFGSVLKTGLMKAGGVVADGLQVAAPFVPGGAIVSAALAGANAAAGMAGPSYAGAGGGIGSSVSGLASGGGGGPAGGASAGVGNYGGNGALAIPGARPGLNTNLSGGAQSAGAGTGAVAGAGAGAGDSFNSMMSATKQMSEFQASFNLQYLQLQEKIQTDTRQFNLISNIMKTKHDAAKNALNNVR
jgi:hypothetical protein